MKKEKIMLASSCGGHFTQLLQLEPFFKKFNYTIITENTGSVMKLKDKYNIHFIKYCSRRNKLSFPFLFIYNCVLSLIYLIKYNPKIIITTGAGIVVPLCYLAKLFGKKIVYIESYARRNSKSTAGKLIYPIANLFIVQWKEMLELYPKAKYFGTIY